MNGSDRVPIRFRWTADGCEACARLGVEPDLVPPADVITEEPDWVFLAYRCQRGHVWTCGWAPTFAADLSAMTRREFLS